ncbi:hypothetical protein M426DRAFT_252294 [Hypoxylon sp. CI-4A]|nr:hypothetical protein M426DRAFT_252294 [Hypoxylon sp. CI-4A]
MEPLSPLNRLMPRGYVRQMLCFPSTHADVAEVLKAGLAGVVADVPYLLSGVATSNDSKHVSLSEPYQTLEDLYSEQDISDVINYEVIKRQSFPPSAFAVPDIIPSDTQPPFSNPAPVFRARLSLVKGGFILCIAVHHCTTDITGFGALLKIWASYCKAGVSTAAGFDRTWLNRRDLLERPGMFAKQAPTSIPELLHVREPDEHAKLVGVSSRPSDLTTGIFFFPQETLYALKKVVNDYIASEGSAGWVSSGDILTALLWSAILDAEQDPAAGVEGFNTIGCPVNFRSRLKPPLSPDYLGAAFVMTTATVLREDLVSFATGASPSNIDTLSDSASISRLAKIATTIRASLQRVDEEIVRNVLAYLDTAPNDHPPIILGPRHDGISIVSWADQSAYELDWGEIVGKCDAVRLPKLVYKRYPIVLPRIPNRDNETGGGLEVIVSFDKQIFERFAESWPIKRFASLRCYS